MTKTHSAISAQPPENKKREPLPYANPHAQKTQDPAVAAKIKEFDDEYGNKHNERVPVVNPDPIWTLTDVVGSDRAKAIEATGVFEFHTVGDTGDFAYPISTQGEVRWNSVNQKMQVAEGDVISGMTQDVSTDRPDTGPAFLFHLGDVNYFDNTRDGYFQQFYEPFAGYPNKIIAIPGNHDCEVKLSQQNFMLEAFLENFCQPQPSVPPAGQKAYPPREMVAQPGVYWRLDAPFVQIIALCSNVGENGGSLRGQYEGDDMYNWFLKTLGEVADGQKKAGDKRLALIVALHHPPYTKGNHQPSKEMNDDLDAAFKKAGVWPDLVLAAHDHDAQRFTRYVETGDQAIQIPYCIYGGGGRAQFQRKQVPLPPNPFPDVHVESFGHGNGYAIVTASQRTLAVEYRPTPESPANQPDKFTIDLRLRQVSS